MLEKRFDLNSTIISLSCFFLLTVAVLGCGNSDNSSDSGGEITDPGTSPVVQETPSTQTPSATTSPQPSGTSLPVTSTPTPGASATAQATPSFTESLLVEGEIRKSNQINISGQEAFERGFPAVNTVVCINQSCTDVNSLGKFELQFSNGLSGEIKVTFSSDELNGEINPSIKGGIDSLVINAAFLQGKLVYSQVRQLNFE